MFFAINNSGQVTTIGAQLSAQTAEMVAAMGVTAPASVPLPPSIDDVGRGITTEFFGFAVDLFDKMVQGAKIRVDAAPHLPAVEVAYTAEDGTGSSRILAQGSGFGK